MSAVTMMFVLVMTASTAYASSVSRPDLCEFICEAQRQKRLIPDSGSVWTPPDFPDILPRRISDPDSPTDFPGISDPDLPSDFAGISDFTPDFPRLLLPDECDCGNNGASSVSRPDLCEFICEAHRQKRLIADSGSVWTPPDFPDILPRRISDPDSPTDFPGISDPDLPSDFAGTSDFPPDFPPLLPPDECDCGNNVCLEEEDCPRKKFFNHETCQCECKPKKCKGRKFQNEETCDCECYAVECLPGYVFLERSCMCKCRRRSCPPGLVFNRRCCECRCNKYMTCEPPQYFSKTTCQCEFPGLPQLE